VKHRVRWSSLSRRPRPQVELVETRTSAGRACPSPRRSSSTGRRFVVRAPAGTGALSTNRSIVTADCCEVAPASCLDAIVGCRGCFCPASEEVRPSPLRVWWSRPVIPSNFLSLVLEPAYAPALRWWSSEALSSISVGRGFRDSLEVKD